jgi:hypothetical protein
MDVQPNATPIVFIVTFGCIFKHFLTPFKVFAYVVGVHMASRVAIVWSKSVIPKLKNKQDERMNHGLSSDMNVVPFTCKVNTYDGSCIHSFAKDSWWHLAALRIVVLRSLFQLLIIAKVKSIERLFNRILAFHLSSRRLVTESGFTHDSLQGKKI